MTGMVGQHERNLQYINGTATSWILIKKVTITETPPTVSFNITPANVPITCGSTTPTTFTVHNGASTTGITNYTWNLGATPNGWNLPNGTAAPATYSTGLTDTLSLTPVCGALQKNISATVMANGSSYNTNTSTVSIVPPEMLISGTKTICSGFTDYTISGLPCNASVSWSISPASGVANLSCNPPCTTASLTYVSAGNITLTAVVSNICGAAPKILTLDIGLGIKNPALTAIPVSLPGEPTKIKVYSSYVYGNTDPIPEITYNWYLDGYLTAAHTNSFIWFIQCKKTSTLESELVNACGTSQRTLIEETGECRGRPKFMVSPNPAVNLITVSAIESNAEKNNQSYINEIKIYDLRGGSKKIQSFSNTKNPVIDISSLKNGNYFIEISTELGKERQQLIIKK